MWKWLKSATASLFWAVVFWSCGGEVPDGYRRLPSGIFFKLNAIGDDTAKCKPGDYAVCNLIYATADDSVFFQARRTVLVSTPAFPGAVDECFLQLAKGDSASFYISADSFFVATLRIPLPEFMIPESYMKIHIGMTDIKSPEEFEKEKTEFLAWISDFGEYEQTILKHYFEKEQISVNPDGNKIYPRTVKPGNGIKPVTGDTVTVHFEGRFLDGKIFDSTIKRKEPFRFVLGTEWQVIEGLEKGIRMMDEGSKAIFIIPSRLAFGSNGSSTGIIGPFTTVIFEVELCAVKKGK
jgi:FKBP-type peptidyl-prolyl cis-trans isomerase